MGNTIKNVYIVHHSHTDIGYTDLQEQVVYNHIYNIKKAIHMIDEGYKQNTDMRFFKWNCETYYCVEQFLAHANEAEKELFFELVRRGNIGISGTYLNFNDLVDCGALSRKTKQMQELFTAHGLPVNAAMNADINGISMGARDILIENGIEFLFTNIHTHHGMYPLYKNQTPYFWEAENGKRLLVWSGEHYNLGNALGIVYNKNTYYMTKMYFGDSAETDPVDILHENLQKSIKEYEDDGYPYPFYITSVSGVFSDNAPPNPTIIPMINEFNKRYGGEVRLQMVTVSELYDLIRDQLKDAPVYRGDLNDWWANGVGSTPYSLKHYKEAQRLAHICDRLEEKTGIHNDALADTADENMLLYAEHTWGHSSTITNPYDTMVQNLDIRNTSYASKAHEASAMRKNEQCHALGDSHYYYNTTGTVKAVNLARTAGKFPVEFYVETAKMSGIRVTDPSTGAEIPAQMSAHPRGVLVSFVSFFEAGEEKIFRYEEIPDQTKPASTRVAFVGAERVRDIENNHDTESYLLPYQIENDWFKLSYRIGEGFTSFYDKQSGKELLKDGINTFFTPLYENTEIRTDVYEERRRIGRNIRGLHAKLYQAELTDVTVTDCGPVFVTVKFTFSLPGTVHTAVIVKMYRELPRIDFKLQIGKTISHDIESMFLPLSLNTQNVSYIKKGGVMMRPGIDQLPGTNMEYYTADHGVVFASDDASYLISTLDTALLYQGEMRHHPIHLCDNKEENNARPLYSWIMNNTWETNFKMDLSGFTEYCYAIERVSGETPNASLDRLEDRDLGVVTFITGE